VAIDDRSEDAPAPAGRPADPPPPDPAAAAALAKAADELGRLTDREPSVGLVPAVMHSVWAELRPGRLIPLPGGGGRLLVGSTAVATAITGRLDDLADVVVRRCTVEPLDQEPGRAGSPPLRIELTAAVAYGAATAELSAQVRSLVIRTVDELFGLAVDRVDIDVDDVFATGPGR
jgi:hypothetical protein